MMNNENAQTTHFGYEQVDITQKTAKVNQVFDDVASRYDIMNDLMSCGMHRLWKRLAILLARVRADMCILDLACGSADLGCLLAQKLQGHGQLILSDINNAMLQQGRDKMINHGYLKPVDYIQANAEALPFANNQFHIVTMGFGLRNVTDKQCALQQIYRVLKPGGSVLILEFSKPLYPWLNKLYDAYSFHIIPRIGQWITHNRDAYQYLVESIRRHPDQATLTQMMEQAGFADVTVHNIHGGIVAIHQAYKY